MSFRLKTILGVAFIEAILLAILVISAMNFLRTSSEEALLEQADTTSRLVASTVTDAVLSTDLAYLESYLNQFVRNRGIAYARVISGDDTLAEAGEKEWLSRPFVESTSLDNTTDDVFSKQAGIEVGGTPYGRVEVGFYVNEIRELLESARREITSIAIIEIVLVGLFSFVLGLILTRQLTLLSEGAKAVAEGGPGFQIENSSKDELGQTIDAFNRMSRELKVSQDALANAYSHIMQSVNEGVITFSHDGTLEDVNRAAAELFQIKQGQQDGLVVEDIFPDIDLRKREGELIETMGTCSDGSLVSVELTISRVTLNDNLVLRTCVVRDVTERNEARQRLAEYAERLEEKNRDLGDFAYVASHDLQEPLRKVLSYGDLLEEECSEELSDVGRRYLSRIKDSSARMKQRIQDLLSYARVDSRTGEMGTVDLNELITGVVSDLDVAISEAGATVNIGELPSLVGEPTQFRQLLQPDDSKNPVHHH